jgi:hypothetical protein
LAAEVLCSQRADFARPHDEHTSALQTSEDLLGEGDGRKADRYCALPKRCFRAHALPYTESPVECFAEERAGAAAFGRRLVRILHLTQDLRLTEHERVEPGGDAEQMVRSRSVFMGEQMRQKRLAREPMVVAEKYDQLFARP